MIIEIKKENLTHQVLYDRAKKAVDDGVDKQSIVALLVSLGVVSIDDLHGRAMDIFDEEITALVSDLTEEQKKITKKYDENGFDEEGFDREGEREEFEREWAGW
jgi:hypothetical protein